MRNTSLVACDGHRALVVGATSFQVKWLATKFGPQIARLMESALGYQVTLEFRVLTELLEGGAEDVIIVRNAEIVDNGFHERLDV